MFYAAMVSTLETIIHSYLAFIAVLLIILILSKYLYHGNMKQTKAVEGFMTLGGLLVAFGIPYITLTLSRVQSLAIIVITPILVGALAIYFLNKRIIKNYKEHEYE